jgi:integrase/recombinase XerD
MLEELQRRNFAPTTISTYLHAVEQFARHFQCRPDRLNQTHFRSYQAYLLRERKMRPADRSPPCRGVALLLREDAEAAVPVRRHAVSESPAAAAQILSIEEVKRVIDAADSLSHRTMLMVLYSTDMGNAELRHLEVADIDSRRMLIHIQRGKGGRGRYVRLSPTLLTTLRVYYRWMRPKTWLFPGTVHGCGAPTSRSRPRSSGMPVSSRPVAPGFANGARRTSCAIRTPRTCSRVAQTSGRFSCSWAMWRSGTRCCVSISRRSICRPSRIRWMRSRFRGPTRHVGPG